MATGQIVVSKSEKSYDPILTILSSSESLLIFARCLLEVRQNNTNTQANIQHKIPIMIPRGNSTELLCCDPDSLLSDLANNNRPNSISIDLISNFDSSNLASGIKAPDISFIRKSIIQGAFIQFFELNKPNINLKSWPNNWKFAWVIRNAFAHGGKIKWTDKRIQKVQWDNFSYERKKDNGKEIIFKGFAEADIILLLIQLK